MTGSIHATPAAYPFKEQSTGRGCLAEVLKEDQIRDESVPRWPPEGHRLHTKDIGRVRTIELSSLSRTVASVIGAGVWHVRSERGGHPEDFLSVMVSPGSTMTVGRREVNCIPVNFLESCMLGPSAQWILAGHQHGWNHPDSRLAMGSCGP